MSCHFIEVSLLHVNVRNSWQLISEGSLACYVYFDNDHPFYGHLKRTYAIDTCFQVFVGQTVTTWLKPSVCPDRDSNNILTTCEAISITNCVNDTTATFEFKINIYFINVCLQICWNNYVD